MFINGFKDLVPIEVLGRYRSKIKGYRYNKERDIWVPLWYKIRGWERSRKLSRKELYERGVQSLDMYSYYVVKSMLNCKKLAKMLEKKYSEGAGGHYITSPKFRVLRMEADSMAKKLRYYYERMRVLHDKFAYINRVKRGYPLKILGENLLTIKDGHVYGDPPKNYRLCRFYECDEFFKIDVWYGYRTGDFKYDIKIFNKIEGMFFD